MARIESLGEFFHFTNKGGRRVRRKERPRRFGAILSESLSEAAEAAEAEELDNADLEELLDGVHAAGDALKQRQSEQNTLTYRRAVQAFLRYVLRRAYDTVRQRSRRNVLRGTEREYLLIRTVDEKLERLMVDVLRDQLEQLELVQRIEEINGLLVNLLT